MVPITQDELAKLAGFRELNGEKHPDDLAEARRLLAEAGYPNGFKATLTPWIVVEFVEIAGVLSDQLRRYLNIDVTIKPMELTAGQAAAAAGNYELGVWGARLL